MIEILEARIAPATIIVHDLSSVISAINNSGAGDTVKFAHNLKGTVTVETAFEIAHDVKILGNGKVILQSTGSDRLFNLSQSETKITLEGLILQGGASDEGGAIFSNANLKVLHCTLSGNTSTDDGGAINVAQGSLLVKASKFAGNSATDTAEGGAIYAFGGTNVKVKGTTFLGNSANDGGAIGTGLSAAGVQLTVIRSTFLQNTADDQGGAIYDCVKGGLTIKGSDFRQNNADGSYGAVASTATAVVKIRGTKMISNTAANSGGALGVLDGSAKIVGGVIRDNQALAGNGGGIYSTADSLILKHGKVTQNSAANTGGGIYSIGPAGALSVQHSKVKHNDAPNSPQIYQGQIIVP